MVRSSGCYSRTFTINEQLHHTNHVCSLTCVNSSRCVIMVAKRDQYFKMTSSVTVARSVAEFDAFTAIFKLNTRHLIHPVHTATLFSVFLRHNWAVRTTKSEKCGISTRLSGIIHGFCRRPTGSSLARHIPITFAEHELSPMIESWFLD